jgi:hypothetical protein
MTTTSKATSRLRRDDLAGIRGGIITQDDPQFDSTRAVFNGAVDRHPLAIVRCADVADVLACVAYARDNVLPLAIRGGAHHGGGFGSWDDALVIDLGGLRSTTVDPEAGTVRADGGCVWGDVDHATGAFGMALPSGFVSTTGVGGLTLGGGIGYLTRRFGLTIDNLISADVVLADGRFVTTSAESHSDLFWALRGGGGNFGVVTSFTFRCHPVGERGVIIGGPVLYDIADVEDLFRWYRDLLPTLPEDLGGWIGVAQIPAAAPFPRHLWSRKAGIITWCYTGPHARADAALSAIRGYGDPLLVGLAPMPYSVLQSAFDALLPKGMQWYWRPTSSKRSPTRPSRCIAGTARRSRRRCRPCTCTPSAVRRPECPRTRPPLPTAMAAGQASSLALTQTQRIFRQQPAGHSSTGRRCIPVQPEAAT